jgi:chemotaxis protein MotA
MPVAVLTDLELLPIKEMSVNLGDSAHNGTHPHQREPYPAERIASGEDVVSPGQFSLQKNESGDEFSAETSVRAMNSPALPLPLAAGRPIRQRRSLAKGAVCGAVLSLLSVAAGFSLEGGRLPQLLQSTALLVVCGGTLGAVMLHYPMRAILDAMRAACLSLCTVSARSGEDVQRLHLLATRVRRERNFSFEREADVSTDTFLSDALRLLAENQAAADLSAVLEQMADGLLEHEEEAAAVFEAAGGFSPTMGLLGAILGLIQVMNHLGRIDEVGRGIAIAFTATIYGVAAANLILLPLAGRIRIRAQHLRQRRQLLIQGLLCIAARLSPAEMEARLHIFAESHGGLLRAESSYAATRSQAATEGRPTCGPA